VPLAVFNNVEGADHRVLSRFKEPAWNNPVVRIVDADEKPLAPRFAGDYSTAGLAANLIAALKKAKRPVPGYLRLLALRPSGSATFSMHCFWAGEAALGALDGVAETRTGWQNGREVVELRYDGRRLDRELLAKAAKQAGFSAETAGKLSPSPKDDKYRLRRSLYRFVPMTRAQASKVNAALGRSSDPRRWLSPRQLRLLRRVEARPKAGWPVVYARCDAAAFEKAEAVE
jgi:hypothetical protein